MAQNSFFLGVIDREATKVRANAHLQNSLPGKGIPLKTTQTSLKIFWELYSAVLKFPVSKILQVICPLRYAFCGARPIRS